MPACLKADVVPTLVNRLWDWLGTEISDAASITTPSHRRDVMRYLAALLLGVLRSAAIADRLELREAIIDTVCDPTVELSQILFEVVGASTQLPPDQLDEVATTGYWAPTGVWVYTPTSSPPQ